MKAWRAAEQRKIATAAYFTVCRLIGPAKYSRSEHPTLAAAQQAKRELGADEYGRRGMIYAVTELGESIFVE